MSIYFPLVPVLPVTLEHITLFIAYCSQQNLSYNTVATYVSTVNYVQKMAGFPDIANNFVAKKMLQGLRKLTARADTRLPITPSILKALIQSLDHFGFSSFIKTLLKAMHLLAFHAFLRIGEITQSDPKVQNNLAFHAVKFLFANSSDPYAFELNFEKFKHHTGVSCHKLLVKENQQQLAICPVKALWEYCKVRGQMDGPLFCFLDGTPISRRFFTQKMQLSLNWANCSPKDYKGHSFRIGAATSAASMGISEQQIQVMGRWRSEAFKKYIRFPLLQI